MSDLLTLPNIPNNSYDFTSISTVDLIENAYISIGIHDLSNADESKARIALNYLNEILESWLNRQILQFNEYLSLTKLQNRKGGYKLPKEIFDIYDVAVSSFTRLQGTPFCFDSTGIDPDIVVLDAFSYNFNNLTPSIPINYYVGTDLTTNPSTSFPLCWAFGLSANIDTSVQFQLFGSNLTTAQLKTSPLSDSDLLFDSRRNLNFSKSKDYNSVQWWVIDSPQPYTSLFFKFNKPIELNKIFLLNFVQAQPINNMGRSDYIKSLTNPLSYSRPSFISLEKNNAQCNIRTYPIVDGLSDTFDYNSINTNWMFNFLYFRCSKLPFSIDYMSTDIDMNYRFVPALRSALSAKLALAYNPQMAEQFKQEAEIELRFAMQNDRDNQNISFVLGR